MLNVKCISVSIPLQPAHCLCFLLTLTSEVQGECRIKLACSGEPQPLLAMHLQMHCKGTTFKMPFPNSSEFYRVFAVFTARKAHFTKKSQNFYVTLQ